MSKKLEQLESLLKQRKKEKVVKQLDQRYRDCEDDEFIFPTGDFSRQIDSARFASPLTDTWRTLCRI